ncbi:MAG: serine hydrolase [Gammaproteobacteria bacterium]|nr:serine hydrolase [Gammaproteobacteria bacterium]MBU1553512.1 serine hydrolase [Gammaproteobacteria bacterium]MBU2069280.1 serine hydrolase [Gammaproteobacteria bacterium]MBU2183275.1 serine hydrolase [Gammaproteobacteria bacterium]MBU2204490.1 serine hydrolase [Gammaproteobacteria bacterium]
MLPEKLHKAQQLYQQHAFASVLVIKNGAVVLDWGENTRRFPIHSIRKSLLSALYGVHSAQIDLQATLAELNITDTPPLTEQERMATLFDVLASRSGVYLPAAAETSNMTQQRPARGSHPAGQYWWYNNWDFNVAGTLYRQLTGEEIFSAFATHLAKPLQLEDYREFDGYYLKSGSEHAAFQFRMSSRDLARVGLLYAREGNWRGTQIIPSAWIKQSTQAISQTNMGAKYPAGYGLSWWVDSHDSYSARGAGGHVLAVYPQQDLVIVLRVNSYIDQSVPQSAIKNLLSRLESAMQGPVDTNPELAPAEPDVASEQPLPARYHLAEASISLPNGQVVTLKQRQGRLFINYGRGDFESFYVNDDQFVIADLNEPLQLELDSAGTLTDILTPRVFYLRAAEAAKAGDLTQAQMWVQRVIDMMPNSSIAYTNLAKVLLAQQLNQDASKNLDIALQLDPDNKQAENLKQSLLIKQWLLPSLFIVTIFVLFWFAIKRRSRAKWLKQQPPHGT